MATVLESRPPTPRRAHRATLTHPCSREPWPAPAPLLPRTFANTPLVSRELVVGAAFGGIYRAYTDGEASIRLYDQDADIHGTAYDPVTGYYYWAVYGSGEIHRGGNGDEDEVVVSGMHSAESVCVNPDNRTIYFGNRESTAKGLMRADAVTGEGVTTVVSGVQVSDCVVDASNSV